ncbi:MAG: pilus assembly protein PilZ [Methyloprofundus sp.]|nr:pilus assembly protein PilZ [Methyloprofundus sp.]
MAESTGRQGILSLSIKEKNALYTAYMPFVDNGGLFIPTKRIYKMGQEVFMLLDLMEEQERLPVAGEVIWITPIGAEGNKLPGIGVQFSSQDGGLIRSKIETYLAGTASSVRVTHTM